MKKIVLFVLIIMFIACNKHSENINNGIQDTLLSKVIIFPKELLKLENDTLLDAKLFLEKNKSLPKIVSIIDGTCIKCIINQLNVIDNIFKKVNMDKEVLFILNVNHEDSVYFFKYIKEHITENANILWDSNYFFETVNQIFNKDINKRTFLLDTNNKIVIYGNPTLHPEIINKYKNY